jgi:nicotinate-nucleotide adenylyltransferase
MKIAILGGSFNPIQNAHLAMARYILNENIKDEVWLMPCKKHPLSKTVIDEKDRVNMINLAIQGIPRIKLCDLELKKDNTSYTFQTLRELKKNYNHDFSFVIGTDILNQMNKWHGLGYLQKEAKFLVFKRPGYNVVNPGLNIEKVIDWDEMNTSSTEVRTRISKREYISDLVPKKVEEYIICNGLYR